MRLHFPPLPRRHFAILALASLSFPLLSCGKKDGSDGASGSSKKPQVALVLKSLANEFFQTMAEGGKKYHASHSSEFDLISNGIKNETDLAEQVSLMEQMVARGANAIVLAPADSKALISAIRKAKEAGVLVINIDNKLDDEVLKQANLEVPFVGPDNRDGARRVAEVVAKQLKEGDKVAIIEGVSTAFNGQQRRLGAEDALKAAKLNIVSVQGGQWEMDKANAIASALLSEHSDLKAIVCGNDSMALGAVAAVNSAGRTGQVLVSGFDAIDAVKPMIADGRMIATANQHGDELAKFGIEAALQILKGEAVPADKTTAVDVITK